MLSRKLPLETFVKRFRERKLRKTCRENVPLKATLSKCCSKKYRTKRPSKTFVAQFCQKNTKNTVLVKTTVPK